MRRLVLIAVLMLLTAVSAVPVGAYGHGQCQGQHATITGNEYANYLEGTPNRDVIQGAGGQDTIVGRGGNDLICGGKGKDRLFGSAGDDFMNGGPGLYDYGEGEGGHDACINIEFAVCEVLN